MGFVNPKRAFGEHFPQKLLSKNNIQMKNKELANLHEELLHFLLKYRNESKYIDNPNFLFRPANHIEALKEGRWFYDNPKLGWVDIYFTKSGEERHHQNNLQFRINTDGSWNISLYASKQAEKFWDHLIRSFSNVAKLIGLQRFTARFEQIILSPIDKNYRTGLPEAINTLFQFFRQERTVENTDKKNIPISLVSEDIFQESLHRINEYRNKQKVRCVYLNGFHIKNYQGIKDTQIDDLPQNPSWIFLTGENGFGKTCLLKALAIGLYGDEEDIITPRNKESETEVSYTCEYQYDRKIRVNNNIGEHLFFRPLQALAAYGPSRLEIQARDSYRQQAKNSTATYNLFHTDGILKNIESELLISHYDAPAKFEELCKMLKSLIPSLDKIELDKKLRKILYYEKAEKDQTESFDPVEYEYLASGIRSIVAMTGDIYLRLSDAQQKMHNSLLKKTGLEKPLSDYSVCAPDELFGIVIIDELDLHLHPKWQRELPALLSEVFPNVQFIASTHSPIPLLGVPLNSVFLKVDRTTGKGIEVKRLAALEKDISNLLPNSVLTSPIFDLDHFFPVKHDSEELIETADYYQAIVKKNALEKELQLLAQNFKFPEELKKKDEKSQ
ncbi:AAA family ATPase [Desulfococcaceae bacterium HSG8]|nr:AAA family ATPase [Desulfococcaceae bacterium HSG8]